MGAKIYVIKLKQIICVLVSLAVIAAVAAGGIFALRRGSRPTYSPGVYTACIVLHNSPVNVEVEVSKHSIESVRVLELSETQQVFYPLFTTTASDIAERVVAEQSCDITLDSESAVTGGIILDAVGQALEKAKK